MVNVQLFDEEPIGLVAVNVPIEGWGGPVETFTVLEVAVPPPMAPGSVAGGVTVDFIIMVYCVFGERVLKVALFAVTDEGTIAVFVVAHTAAPAELLVV